MALRRARLARVSLSSPPDLPAGTLRTLTSPRASLLQPTTSKAQINLGLSLRLDEKRESRQLPAPSGFRWIEPDTRPRMNARKRTLLASALGGEPTLALISKTDFALSLWKLRTAARQPVLASRLPPRR